MGVGPGVTAEVPTPMRLPTETPQPANEPSKIKSGQEAVKQLGEIAKEAITGKKPSTEALAGIAGYRAMRKDQIRLTTVAEKVSKLCENKKVNGEKAAAVLKRIGEIDEMIRAFGDPIKKKFEAAQVAEQSGKHDDFLRDLDYQYLKREIAVLEADDPNNKNLQELKNRFEEVTKERGDLKPEDDEVIKLAASLAGQKNIEKLKDGPLEAIDKFFQLNTGQILKSEKIRAALAKQTGIEENSLLELAQIYEKGSEIERSIRQLEAEVDTMEHPGKAIAKKTLMVGGLGGGLFVLLMAYMASRKTQEGAAGHGG